MLNSSSPISARNLSSLAQSDTMYDRTGNDFEWISIMMLNIVSPSRVRISQLGHRLQSLQVDLDQDKIVNSYWINLDLMLFVLVKKWKLRI